MRKNKTMLICRPCAEKLKATMEIRKVEIASRKETCCECGRRRYCSKWEIEGENQPILNIARNA